jgi:AbrB family looped-hinge helix DNA binding protein
MARPKKSSGSPPTGLAEDTAPFGASAAQDVPTQPPEDIKRLGKFKVGPGGRVLVPAEVRQELGVKEGDMLLASICDGELRLISITTAIRRAQESLRKYIPDGGPSAVDELIAERRRENEKDSAESFE